MVNDAEATEVVPSPDLTFSRAGRIHSGYLTPEMGPAHSRTHAFELDDDLY